MFSDVYITMLVFGEIFFSDIIPHFHKRRINKNIARTHLHLSETALPIMST